MMTPASDATTATPVRSHLRETSLEVIKLDKRICSAPAHVQRAHSAMHHVGLPRYRAERLHGFGIPKRWICRVRLLDVLRERAARVRTDEHKAAATCCGAGRKAWRIGRRQSEVDDVRVGRVEHRAIVEQIYEHLRAQALL